MTVRGVNKVIIVGNLGQDPEIRYIPNGSAVANLSLATSESWRDKQTGEMRENTEWHRVVLFGKLAEVAGEYSRLPMTWHTQLKDGISRIESLRSSPLRQMDEANAHYDWHYASYCLAAEIQLIYSALSQPARPFSA